MGITAYREYFDFNQTGSDPMKIERINENQIRCTLSNFDLSVRNMNLGELAYGTEKARNLFREMIQRAANEVGFEAEDIPLMVEAIPMANESVMLIITKMEDPEELDTRFSKFSPEEDENDNGWGNLTAEVLEGADGLNQYPDPERNFESRREKKLLRHQLQRQMDRRERKSRRIRLSLQGSTSFLPSISSVKPHGRPVLFLKETVFSTRIRKMGSST